MEIHFRLKSDLANAQDALPLHQGLLKALSWAHPPMYAHKPLDHARISSIHSWNKAGHERMIQRYQALIRLHTEMMENHLKLAEEHDKIGEDIKAVIAAEVTGDTNVAESSGWKRTKEVRENEKRGEEGRVQAVNDGPEAGDQLIEDQTMLLGHSEA
ncbi:uncharacterized protein EI97DRAFT_431370 [Westerdykella ornata]|uniref:Uncharacterized protein n=1 Tax=Westerdykella ornata TaxID=318751 RepID=A0A6A6JSZ8_WESOR|nr:uncharacterized protein EI97DRAFT_431370 [Westerdykella ornata]KAF2278109.1 hypothetical protein EI97DRAFT_431370 [Westerdykella ornata]